METVSETDSKIITANGVMSSRIKPDISYGNLETLASIHNEEWGSVFHLTPEVLSERIKSGAFFVNVFLQDSPIGINETSAFYVPIGMDKSRVYDQQYALEKAREVCEFLAQKYRNYNDLTDNGRWLPHQSNSNVLVLVDITVAQLHKKLGAGANIVDFVKATFREDNGFERPYDFCNIEFIISFSPDIESVIKFHLRNYGLDTGYIWLNARQGYKQPDVRPILYLGPGYRPLRGTRPA